MKTKSINLAINVIAILLIISIIVFIGVGMKCWGCLWYRPTIVENNNSENNSENNNTINNPIMLAQYKNSKKHKKNKKK